jgi:hypothetical protein
MDPVQVRLMQLLVIEVLGVVLCLGGLVLLFLGTTGKIGFFLKGPGIQAKLTNGTPGLVIALIGGALIMFSLKGSVSRESTGKVVDPNVILAEFTDKAKALQKQANTPSIDEMKDSILGTDAVRKIVSSSIRLAKPETLSQLSQQVYGKGDYWPLVAAINLDRNLYDFHQASGSTLIPQGKLMEIWQVSRYYGQTESTIIKLSGPAVSQGNEELLQKAKAGGAPDIPALQDAYKAREIVLEYGPAQTGGLQTLRELAIKYYGDAKFWTILVWTNPENLAGSTENSPIPHGKDLYILHFIP